MPLAAYLSDERGGKSTHWQRMMLPSWSAG